MFFEKCESAPSSIDMKPGTRVKVLLDDEWVVGEFIDAAPDGSYKVRLDNLNQVYSFAEVVLE